MLLKMKFNEMGLRALMNCQMFFFIQCKDREMGAWGACTLMQRTNRYVLFLAVIIIIVMWIDLKTLQV